MTILLLQTTTLHDIDYITVHSNGTLEIARAMIGLDRPPNIILKLPQCNRHLWPLRDIAGYPIVPSAAIRINGELRIGEWPYRNIIRLPYVLTRAQHAALIRVQQGKCNDGTRAHTLATLQAMEYVQPGTRTLTLHGMKYLEWYNSAKG